MYHIYCQLDTLVGNRNNASKIGPLSPCNMEQARKLKKERTRDRKVEKRSKEKEMILDVL